MKKFKKAVSISLVLLMALGMGNISAMAADESLLNVGGSAYIADVNDDINDGNMSSDTNDDSEEKSEPGNAVIGEDANSGDGTASDVENDDGTGTKNDSGNSPKNDGGTDLAEAADINAVKIGNKGYETLQEAINDAKDNDTIVLTKDFSATEEEKPISGGWLYEISAAKISSLTIDLDGHTIDCGDKYGWLYVNSGNKKMNLTVKNGRIQNTGKLSQGSAIWAWNTLNLDNMTFSNCSASSYGGAVFVGSSDETTVANITNCRFVGNKGGSGGALYVAMAKEVEISGSTFESNQAVDQYGFGGAFYVDHGSSTVTVKDCSFTGNQAVYGGAMSAYDNVTLNVKDCSLKDNSASVCGGAVYITGNTEAARPAKLQIIDGEITGNNAQHGGAIYAYYMSPSTIDGAKFDKNTASNYGGAVYAGAVKMTLRGTAFAGNQAAQGGAWYQNSGAVTLNESTIINNMAKDFGGGIVSYFAALNMENGAGIYNNTAQNMGDDIFSSDQGYAETNPATLELLTPENATLASDGRTITGWFVDGYKSGETANRWGADNFYEAFDKNVSVIALKAAHEPYYTVTYTDGVDGEEVFPDQSSEVKLGAATPDFNGTPTRSGYTFTGWSPAVAETVTGDMTYTAQWRFNGYPVTYYTVTYTDGVDGEVVFADQTTTVAMGESTPAFNGTPTREGYTFTGWSPAVADTVTGDAVYFAQWSENANIDDPDVPLGPGPDDPVIDDPDVPLGPGPDEPVIDDPDVPLAPAPAEDADSNQPKTGDEAPLALLMGMFLVSAGALGATVIRRKEKAEK